MMQTRRMLMSGVLAVGLVLTAGCATVGSNAATQRQDVTATATAPYKPVDMPGTQRRTAQNDAEAKARSLIMEQVGATRLPRGGTINDAMARNSVMRAEILSAVRTAEVVDWKVAPACGQVTVWMRLDMNCIYGILARYGYY